MKILIVMTGFFPGQKFGGPPVSIDNFCSLMKEHEVFIVTRNHDMGDEHVYTSITSGWNDRGNCKVLYLSDKEYKINGYNNFEKVIQQVSPNLIYLQGLFQNCIIPCLMLAKKYNIRVLLAPRGELCKGAFKKKYKKVPYICFLKVFGLIRNASFQSTSQEETEAIESILGVRQDRISLLSNIPSIPKKNYLHNIKEKGKANLIYLGRIVPKKNLDFALEILRETNGNINLDIYGTIEDKEYWEKCEGIIRSLPSNVKVNYKENIAHDYVHETFAKYDAFIFPTKSENFGHTIVEALAVGCPVIISDQVPWIDVERFNAGWALPLNNKELFSAAIKEIVDADEKQENEKREGSYCYFTKKLKLADLHNAYQKTLDRSSK